MESKLPSSVKVEQLEVCAGQETHSWSSSIPDLSIQEHPQRWKYDSIDMKIVKEELPDVLCEDRNHSFSKMVDITGGSIIQEMTEHSNSESRMVENSFKASVKHEHFKMSEKVSSVIDTNNKLSLAIENCQQQNKYTQEKHTQSFAKSPDDIFDYVNYNSKKTHTGDMSDVSSPNVFVDGYNRTHAEGMSNSCNDWNGLLNKDDQLECQQNINHKRTHTGDKPYKCNDCAASFTRADYLKNHKRTHTGEKPYKCDVCGTSFTYTSKLMTHMKTHTGEKPYKCDVCHTSFTQAGNLKNHKRTHTGEKPYKCNDCGASFTQAEHLKKHKRTHTGEKPYKCNDCGAFFSQAGNLKNHKRTHTGEKPYKCYVCGASFTESGHLKKHKRTHTGERPYKCNDCDASFTQADHLKKHKRTHTGEKPYKCDVCGASFTQAAHLKKHKRTHTGERPYKCDVSFTQAGHVNKHKRLSSSCALPTIIGGHVSPQIFVPIEDELC